MFDLLARWPLVRQILNGGTGTGAESMSEATRSLRPRHEGADVTRSVCPYCAVGCGQLIFHRKGRVIAVEGDPQSPISEGHLCPKGADTFELLTHAVRATHVKYRAPHATAWQDLDLETAMDMIAERVWDSRDRHFREQDHASTLMQCHLDRPPGWRHARQRRELPDQETVRRGPGHGGDQQSGPDMT